MKNRSPFVASVIGNVLPPLTGLLSVPLLAQSLGTSGRGELAAATAPLLLLLSVATFGLPEAVTHFVASHSRAALRLAPLYAVAISTAAVGTIAIVCLSSALASGEPSLQSLIVFSSLFLPAAMAVGIARGIAAGEGRWATVSLEKLLSSGTRLTFLSVAALSNHLSVQCASYIVAISLLAGGVAYLPRKVQAKDGVERVPTSMILTYGAQSWSGSVAGILVMRVDQTLISPLASASELGIYVVAVSVSELTLVINSAIRDVIFTSQSGRSSESELQRAARLSNLVTCAAGTVVVLSAWILLIPLLGKSFAPALPVTTVLVLAIILGNPGSISGVALSARGRPLIRSATLAVALLVNVSMILTLVPAIGAVGAAIATLVANLTVSILNLYWTHRLTGAPPSSYLRIRLIDVTGTRTRLPRVELNASAADTPVLSRNTAKST